MIKLDLNVIEEAGYTQAIQGLSYNKKKDDLIQMAGVANRLASVDGGHNKFLESMQVWIDINAPRYWWQEFDTYRVGITKQSESTMHTLTKDDLDNSLAFEGHVFKSTIEGLLFIVDAYHATTGVKAKSDLFLQLKQNLPEGFMQRRMVCLNYKALRNIVAQRKRHRLPHWQIFCDCLERQLRFPDYLKQKKDN